MELGVKGEKSLRACPPLAGDYFYEKSVLKGIDYL